MGMTVAVTGATGFLGSYLCLELLKRGHAVRGVVRSPEKGAWLAERGVRFARADLADRSALGAAFEGVDAVIGNAALFTVERRSWDDFHAANVRGTENVAEATADAGVKRLVQISSCAVYGRVLFRRLDESAPMMTEDLRGSRSSYAITKAVSERRAWEIGAARDLAVTAIRPCAIYGRRDPNFTAVFQRFLSWPVAPAPGFRMPLIHAGDVAIATVNALERDGTIGRSYNVSGEPVALGTVLRRCRRVLGRRTLLVPVPMPLWVGYDATAAKRDLDLVVRPLDEGLREALSPG